MSRKQKWRSNPDEDDDQLDDSPISLTIETLTGTTFEITVSPTDYISSLKSRIQRVEGLYNIVKIIIKYSMIPVINTCLYAL